MKIEQISVGYLKCNCYILSLGDNVLVVDPGAEADKIIALIGSRKVVGIIITHHHNDHDGGVDALMDKYHTEVYDRYTLSEGENKIAHFTFDVIYTPGHKEDLITIYFKENRCMFCGDFIFRDSIGRCDLAGGNERAMFSSIAKIKKYARDITIYPGHGPSTTLGYEINNNPYFKDYL